MVVSVASLLPLLLLAAGATPPHCACSRVGETVAHAAAVAAAAAVDAAVAMLLLILAAGATPPHAREDEWEKRQMNG